MTGRALAGVRVIELSEVWAGPVGGSLLGDLGADVIKVESFPRFSPTRPIDPNDWRVAPGEGPAYEHSWAQHQGNRNKRNMAINLRHEAGAAAFRRLLERADVVIDSFSAGTMEKLGFDWERMHRDAPRLIRLSLPGLGPLRPLPGLRLLRRGLRLRHRPHGRSRLPVARRRGDVADYPFRRHGAASHRLRRRHRAA